MRMSLGAATVSAVTRVRERWLDVLGIIAVSAFVAVVSQRWTGFTSPDSEFYASLALFGSGVTDRAVEPAYIWTRLGYIAPVRGLVSVAGPWVGFEIWRIFLITLIVGATYSIVHIAGRSRWLGLTVSMFVGLNTVILAFVGNTYLTGTILAALFVLIALAVSLLGHAAGRNRGAIGGPRWTTALASGVIAGWLIMLNPYAFILGSGLWFGVRLIVPARLPEQRWRRAGVDLAAAAVGAAGSFLALWIAGRWIFPGRDWLATYLEWNSRLDYTVFIGDATTWQRDSALLVVVIAFVASVAATLAQPRHRWAWAALALSSMNIVVTVVMMLVFTGPWLETPTYVAKLWPGALTALVLAFTSMSPGSHEDKNPQSVVTIVIGIATIPFLLWSGRFDGVLPYGRALLIAAVVAAAVVALAVVVRTHWNAAVAFALALTMAATFIAAQVLQNGRGYLGTYGQYPFRSAYVDFSYQDQMATKIATQRWLLDRTSDDDTIAIWTDPNRLLADVAAMQMWGGDNLVTLDPTLDRDSTSRLEITRPTVIAMYAPDRGQIEAFYESLPPWSLPSEPDCFTGPYLGVGTGKAVTCLTRLTWVG